MVRWIVSQSQEGTHHTMSTAPDRKRQPSRRPSKFDSLVADVQGVQQQLRNHVNTDLRKLRAGQKRHTKRFDGVDRSLTEIDERLYDHDARFDAIDDSLSELHDLVSFMVYGGEPDHERTPTLWDGVDEDEGSEE